MGNNKYINEVVYNTECHTCGGEIPQTRRQQRFQSYCSKYCAVFMWDWCKREGLSKYYKATKTRFSKLREKKRY